MARFAEPGAYLEGDNGEVLLPRGYLPEGVEVNQELEVFVYCDSEDRLVATTEAPYAQIGEFAALEVTAIEDVGAFLDWGLPKDLFLPHREQRGRLEVGGLAVVYLYLDNTGRISSSMRIGKHLDKTPSSYYEGQAVELLVTEQTDIGYKAIINDRHLGVIYANEIFQDLRYGDRVPGFIKKLREDGKIDLRLQQTGHHGAKDLGEEILNRLHEAGGFLPIGDKSSAEGISEQFGVSKKKFKMALGGLLKRHLVRIDATGTRLSLP